MREEEFGVDLKQQHLLQNQIMQTIMTGTLEMGLQLQQQILKVYS